MGNYKIFGRVEAVVGVPEMGGVKLAQRPVCRDMIILQEELMGKEISNYFIHRL